MIEMSDQSTRRLLLGLFLFICILAAFFRFHWITDYPLGLYPDEAMNGSNTLEALETGEFKVFYPENNGREGFFINIQALSVKYFGNTPWALRGVSAFFGTLTIIGIWLVARELFPPFANRNTTKKGFRSLLFLIRRREIIPVLAGFLTATAFWHINFSRIGFRAILVPFLSSFGIYFLLKGFRKGTILDFLWAGIFIGLGFHTYIAFRMMPLVIAVPILWYGWKWIRDRYKKRSVYTETYCVPCAIVLFLLITFVVALPVGYYFLTHPEDLVGRTGQVSVFAADSPVYEFVKSNVLTLGMFFVHGDCNWRHNLACTPELHPIAAVFFLFGIAASVYTLVKYRLRSFPHLFLLWWALVMTLPATLTREGLPHALRAIGMIPPVFILTGYGGYTLARLVLGRIESWYTRFEEFQSKIIRIAREFSVLFICAVLIIPFITYVDYFFRWSSKPETYYAFATDLYHIGQYLDSLPNETKKYVIVNMSGTEVRGIPMPAQTVMFISDTFTETMRRERNTTYLLPDQLDRIPPDTIPSLIVPLNGADRELRKRIKEKFPSFKETAPGDFVVYSNY